MKYQEPGKGIPGPKKLTRDMRELKTVNEGKEVILEEPFQWLRNLMPIIQMGNLWPIGTCL